MRKYICLLLFYLFTFLPLSAQQGSDSPLRKLQLAEMAIKNFYVDSVNEQKLVEDGIRGMLEKLDPHSTYTDAKETKAMNEPLQGDFEGIGVQFNMIEDTLVVIQPVVNGPSQKVGILSGDRIVSVNDSTIAGTKISRVDIMKRLRGKKGTKVKLGIVRRGVNGILTFVVTRDKIPVHTLNAAYMIRPGVGYICLESFGMKTHKEFMDAVKELEKLKRRITWQIWTQGATELSDDVQYESLFQGFRMVGTVAKKDKTKKGTRATAYKYGEKVTLDYLNESVPEEYRADLGRKLSKLTLEEAKKKS